MSHENNQPSPLTSFERTLAGFSPASPQLDRDRLMFLAGRASVKGGAAPFPGETVEERTREAVVNTEYSVLSTQYSVPSTADSSSHPHSPRTSSRGRPGAWLWPATTAALAATSLALAIALWHQPEPRMVLVERQAPAAAPETISPAPAPNKSIEHFVSPKPVHVAIRIPAENYLRTREVALRMGLDAIGRQPGGSGQPAPTYGDMLLDLSGMKKPVSGDRPAPSLPFNM